MTPDDIREIEAREKAATEHDYTKRAWGHDFGINRMLRGGIILKAYGWGTGIEQGHYLILPNKGETTRYQVDEISYQSNPTDMWFATLEFKPRALLSRKDRA